MTHRHRERPPGRRARGVAIQRSVGRPTVSWIATSPCGLLAMTALTSSSRAPIQPGLGVAFCRSFARKPLIRHDPRKFLQLSESNGNFWKALESFGRKRKSRGRVRSPQKGVRQDARLSTGYGASVRTARPSAGSGVSARRPRATPPSPRRARGRRRRRGPSGNRGRPSLAIRRGPRRWCRPGR